MIPAILMLLATQNPAPPHFDLTSVTLSFAGPGAPKMVTTTEPGHLVGRNTTLKGYITMAYKLMPHQIVGGPAWIDTDAYDIEGKSTEPVADTNPMAMLQTLMAERFALALHRDTRITQVLVLEVAKDGPKLRKTEDAGYSRVSGGMGNFSARAITMRRFVEYLSKETKLPVADHTGLPDAYDLSLTWKPNDPSGRQSGKDPVLAKAIEKQLGLRLVSDKATIEVLVVDHAERPKKN